MNLFGLVIGFLFLLPLFVLIERKWSAIPGKKVFRKGFWTDVSHYAFNGLITGTVAAVFAGILALIVARIINVPLTLPQLQGVAVRDTLMSGWPQWLQLLTFIVFADFLIYWIHRLTHSSGPLWRLHSIHHSSGTLDWLSSVRVHPLNDVFSTMALGLPLILLGFDLKLVAAFVPLLGLYAVSLHANVSWRFGWLGEVIASPVFHRWHHSDQVEAHNKNFSGLFIFWDRLFGTLYLPKDVIPESFGVAGESEPQGYWQQIARPFRSRSQVTETPVPQEPALR